MQPTKFRKLTKDSHSSKEADGPEERLKVRLGRD